MKSPRVDPPPDNSSCCPPEWPSHPAIGPREPRNLVLLAAHQIVLRVGWIFKTESVIMPAFLDHVAGAGWVRGCLPVLNRLGQSVPPVFSANFLKALRYKRRALAAFTVLMSLPFAAMSVAWFAVGGQAKVWPGLFLALYLALYFVFFVFYGLYLVSFGTVQGKLIRPTRRGHLLLVSTFWGALPATLVALWLLPGWLESSPPHWGCVFGATSVCFFLSGLTALLLFEPGDDSPRRPLKQPGSLRDTLRALRQDANLRCLVLAAMLFASGLMIFPHYQALARQRLGLTGKQLALWVITQNVAVAIFSLLVGPLADRRGYRLALRVLLFGSALAPAFAISLCYLPDGLGANVFWLVFIPLGVTPLVLRTLLNYALEICEPEAHPRYLSTVNLCLAVPFLLSPAVGWLVDATSFELVFLTTVCLVMLSGVLTFRLEEPRHRLPPDRTGTVSMGPDP